MIIIFNCLPDRNEVMGTCNFYPFSISKEFEKPLPGGEREMILRAAAEILGYPQSVLDFEEFNDSNEEIIGGTLISEPNKLTTEWEELEDAEIIPEFEDRDPEQFSDREYGEEFEGASGSD